MVTPRNPLCSSEFSLRHLTALVTTKTRKTFTFMSCIPLHKALSCRGSHSLKNFKIGTNFFLFQNLGHLLHFLVLPFNSFVITDFNSLHAFFFPYSYAFNSLYRAPHAKASLKKALIAVTHRTGL